RRRRSGLQGRDDRGGRQEPREVVNQRRVARGARAARHRRKRLPTPSRARIESDSSTIAIHNGITVNAEASASISASSASNVEVLPSIRRLRRSYGKNVANAVSIALLAAFPARQDIETNLGRPRRPGFARL